MRCRSAAAFALVLDHCWAGVGDDVGAQKHPKPKEPDVPWATHDGCAQIVRHFDYHANNSDVEYLMFWACVNKRKELPDFNAPTRPALLSGQDYPVAVTPSKIMPYGYWVLPAFDYVVSNYVRTTGTFELTELSLFKQLLMIGDTFLDIGAHVGSYSIPLASHVGPRGVVHSFEPFRLVFQLLMANVAVNGLSNVHGHHMALGAREEKLRVFGPALTESSNVGATRVFDQVEAHYGESHVLQYAEEETVTVVPLDSFGFERVDLMKIDVEGALDRVLDGARETIARLRPVLAVEYEGGKPPAMLLSWDYRCTLALQVHNVWVCVAIERSWRYPWVARLQEESGRLIVREESKGDRREPKYRREMSRMSPSLADLIAGS